MPFGYGVGDHHALILDIPIELLVGIDLVKIVHPASQRLNSRLPGCSKAYIDSLEVNITGHRLFEQLHQAHTGGYLAEKMARKVIIINKEGKAYMHRAEKICRKIKCCCIPFLPEASIWIRCVQVYYLLLWYHKGKIKNCGNLKQAARRCNIPNPLSLSIQEIKLHLEACKRECAFYQEHGKQFRRQHLKNRKQIALEQEDEEAFKKISAVIQREQQQNFWCKLKYLTGKKRTHSTTSIQVKGQDGTIMERTTQETVEQTIFLEIHEKRYMLAGEAPICNGNLLPDFGYTATTPALHAVLDGTYVAPPNSDAKTLELFAEIIHIRRLVPAGSLSIIITPKQWKQYCKVVNKETSLSESGIHFRQYIWQ
jgi:hypothetical protein